MKPKQTPNNRLANIAKGSQTRRKGIKGGDEVSNPTMRNSNCPLPLGWRWVSLGEVCGEDENRDPRLLPGTHFRYIDISSIDSTSKRIIEARTILGKDAPSRARQLVKANDVLVATTRPNLNAVGLVTPGIERPQRFVRADSMPLLRHDSYYSMLYLPSVSERSVEINVKPWEAEQNDVSFNICM